MEKRIQHIACKKLYRLLMISLVVFFIINLESASAYCRPPISTCPLQDEYYTDAAWRVEGSEVTIYGIVDGSGILTEMYYEIGNVILKDENNGGQIVENQTFASPVKIYQGQVQFFEFQIDKSQLTIINGEAKISIETRNLFKKNHAGGLIELIASVFFKPNPMVIKFSDSPLPKPASGNWYIGDTHYHTFYSNNLAEFGAPLNLTKKSAKELGLDWITITDHSFTLKPGEWSALKTESNAQTDSSFVFIPGEEVSTNDGLERYRHYLAIGINNYIEGDEIEANLQMTQLTPAQLVTEVNTQGGAGYIAHPYYADLFRKEWEEDDYGLNFTGMQIWNYETLTNQFPPLITDSFDNGLNKWLQLLKTGRKVYTSGGSDAHGDFNSLLGKVRTYVYSPTGLTQGGVLTALKNGNSFMTNGPFLALWAYKTTQTDSNLMGNQVNHPTQKQVTLHIYYDTTNFGQGTIKVYKGKIHGAGETLVGTQTVSTSGDAYFYDSTSAYTYYRAEFVTNDNQYRAYTNPVWTFPTLYTPSSQAEGYTEQAVTWETTLDVDANYSKLKLDLNWNAIPSDLDLALLDPNNNTKPITRLGTYENAEVGNPPTGTWTVRVSGQTIPVAYQIFDISAQATALTTTPGTNPAGPGGIDFKEINLNYLSTCDPEKGLNFVIKGEEAQAGDSVIDVNNQSGNAIENFMAGLVIPNQNQWITMDLSWDGSNWVGSVERVDLTFRKTEAAQALFDADVKLKKEQFGENARLNVANPMFNRWSELVKASPYWSEIQASGYRKFPSWLERAWVSPEGIKVNGTGCEIFVTNSTLTVNHVFDWATTNADGYSMSQAAKDDLKARLETWKAEYLQKQDQLITQPMIQHVNNDEKYRDLRRVFTALALAQWYKKQDLSQMPLADIIDTNNISGFEVPDRTDYWNQQAAQLLTTTTSPCNIDGGTCTWSWYGGMLLTAIPEELLGDLEPQTGVAMQNATLTPYVILNNDYYFGGELQSFDPDLIPVGFGVSEIYPEANTNVILSAVIKNSGPGNASSFVVRFYDNYTYNTGYWAITQIGEQAILELKTGEFTLANITWDPAELLGKHEILVKADVINEVDETNEHNNLRIEKVTIYNPYPTATIYEPTEGDYYTVGETVYAAGSGFDIKDGDLVNNSLAWRVDGALIGYGNTANVSGLSVGEHVITLTVTDSDGLTDTAQVLISVFSQTPTTPVISAPTNNSILYYGNLVQFSGSGWDPQEGDLSGSALSWASSLDGILGTGKQFSTSSLSLGNHTITLTATDSDGFSNSTSIQLTIDPGYPSATINHPTEGQKFPSGKNITLNGTATDPQDGVLTGSNLRWSSSVNSYLGTGEILLVSNLSSAVHTITLTAVDSTGLRNETKVNIEVLPPQPPEVSIISPRQNQEYMNGAPVTLKGTATDFEDGSLQGSSVMWSSDKDGSIGSGLQLPVSNLSINNHTISLTATDSVGMSSQAHVRIKVNSNPPIVQISMPSGGDAFEEGGAVTLNGTAIDFEDGELPDSALRWSSNLDGSIGTGKLISVSNLNIGTHLITLEATDSHGVKRNESVVIFVVAKGSTHLAELSDGSSEKNLTFDQAGDQTVYLKMLGGRVVTSSSIKLRGLNHSVSIFFQEDWESGTITGSPPTTPQSQDAETAILAESEPLSSSAEYIQNEPSEYNISNYTGVNLTIDNESTTSSINKGGFRYITSSIIWKTWGVPLPVIWPIGHSSSYSFDANGDGNWQSGATTYQTFNLATYPDITFWANALAEGSQASIWQNIIVGFSTGTADSYSGSEDQLGEVVWIILGIESSYNFISYCIIGECFNEPFTSNDIAVWHKYTIAINNNSTVSFYKDDILRYTTSSSINTSAYQQQSLVVHGRSVNSKNLVDDITVHEGFSFPLNPSLDSTGDLDKEWTYAGEFSTSTTIDDLNTNPTFSQELSDFLQTCTPDADGYCLVPLVFHSDSAGILEVSNISIFYTYADTVLPVIHSINLSPETSSPSGQVQVLVNATDNIELANVTATLEGVTTILTFNSLTGLYEGSLTAPAAVGAYLVNVTATDSIGLSAKNSTILHVLTTAADLLIGTGDITYTPTEPQINDTVEINATIHNFGNTGADNFLVGLLVDGTSVQNNTLSVAANSQSTTNFVWTATAEGNHTIEIVADVSAIIAESSESNNNASVIISVIDNIPPQINSIELVPNLVQPGSTVLIKTNVTDNLGIEKVTAEIEGAVTDLALQPSGLYEGTISAPSTTKDYSVIVWAQDLHGLVSTRQATLTVTSPSADLEVTPGSIQLNPAAPVDGESVKINLTVKNIGGADTGQFVVELLADNSSIGHANLSALAGSEGSTFFNWTATYGTHVLTAIADVNNTITEGHEDNNNATKTISVLDATAPHITTIEFDPEIVIEGNTFSIKAKVIENVAVDSVNANVSGTVIPLAFNSNTGFYEGSTSVSTKGTYPVTVTATDTSGLKGTRGTDLTVHGIAADLTLGSEDVSLIPGNPTDLGTIVVKAIIHNNGNTAANGFAVELLDGATTVGTKTISAAASSTSIAEFNWTATYGTRTLKIKADPTNIISESSETNNEYSRAVNVADITPPPAPNITAMPSGWTTDTTPKISWGAVSDTNGPVTYEYMIDYGDWASTGTSKSFTAPSLSDGIHTIYVRAIDAPGNKGVPGSANVYIDTTAPSSPTVREWHTGMNWSAHNSPFYSWDDPGDVGSGVTNYTIDLNGTTAEINTTVYETNLTTGIYDFKAKAKDALGQESGWSNTVRVYIDTALPGLVNVVSPTHPDQNQLYNIGTPVFNLIPPADQSGIAGYYYLIGTSGNTTPDTASFWSGNSTINITGLFTGVQLNNTTTQEGLPDGTWYFHVVAMDNVGNLGDETAHYKFNIGEQASGPGDSPGGSPGGSPSNPCKPNEIYQNGKCVPKPQPNVTAVQPPLGGNNTTVFPPVTLTESNNTTIVPTEAPTGLIALLQDNPRKLAALVGAVLVGIVVGGFYLQRNYFSKKKQAKK